MYRFAGRPAKEWARVVRSFSRRRPRTFGRLVIVGLMVPYVAWLVFGYRYHFIDGVNLLIHEAGHMLFTPFGQTWHFLGGTLLQIAIPVAFCAYFLRRGERFAGAIVALWVSESVMYTGRYMGDAVARQLPLVGGQIHDWNWLLAQAGILRHAEALGAAVHVFGACLAIAAVHFAWQHRDYVEPVIGKIAPVVVGRVVQAEVQANVDAAFEPEGQSLVSALGGAWQGSDEEDEMPQRSRRMARPRRVLV